MRTPARLACEAALTLRLIVGLLIPAGSIRRAHRGGRFCTRACRRVAPAGDSRNEDRVRSTRANMGWMVARLRASKHRILEIVALGYVEFESPTRGGRIRHSLAQESMVPARSIRNVPLRRSGVGRFPARDAALLTLPPSGQAT